MRTHTPVLAVAAICGLIASPVWAGEGDMDPGFGEHGRLAPVPGLFGPAWKLAALDDDSILLAAGGLINVCRDDDPGCYNWGPVGYRARSIVAGVTSSGSVDPDFNANQSSKLQIRGMARQDDGRLVIVGRRVSETSLDGRLVVRRINVDGSDDLTFGQAGKFLLPLGGPNPHVATSVIVDPDGRIVVAGLMGPRSGLVVVRLLPDGLPDESFASSGVYYRATFSGFYSYDEHPGPALLRTAEGGYRVTDGTCRVLALTQDGALDRTFGNSGVATANANAYCPAIAIQAHGGVIVAGSLDERPFMARLFANGVPDPNFSAESIADSLGGSGWVSALAISGSSIVAACSSRPWGDAGENATAIARLQAGGELDHSFGDAGMTMIDLPSEVGSHAVIHDVNVLEDGVVQAVGGDTWADQPFAVRLLGTQGGESAGVIGMSRQGVLFVEEENQEVILEVRRTGGSSGLVSVRYRVFGDSTAISATAGEDFTARSGRLVWNDGDTSSRQIQVRILDDEVNEEFEQIQVLLSHAGGGAGFGTHGAIVEILAND